MAEMTRLSKPLQRSLVAKKPVLWLNDQWKEMKTGGSSASLGLQDVLNAQAKLQQFGSLLACLFPELRPSGGIIESSLYPAEKLQKALATKHLSNGRWFIKADDALPVAGSVKARGGIYEVLLYAETLALREGLIQPNDDRSLLSSARAQAVFSRYTVAVGSTGNLGLSIGLMAAALGFRARVHMSADAKEWKKTRLRARGVEVIEHSGDFGVAVAAGREDARRSPETYFVDDENSEPLFLGYSVAALRLQQQLMDHDVQVDADHPLFVYLPCGVGGAPSGITFGLRHVYGDQVHCFFAEPVASPCMLVRLAAIEDRPLSVSEVGLDGRTEADGLAVGQASEFVVPFIRFLVSGIYTVPDSHLFEDLYLLNLTQGFRIEPSAAAGFRGPQWLSESLAGRRYLKEHGLDKDLTRATHIIWTTGGAFVPDEEYCQFHARGRKIFAREQ
jgi:D-serine dehydratase